MGFLNALNSDFGVGCTTALIALFGILYGYKKNQDMKFFETFFLKKTEAYESYLAVVELGDYHNHDNIAEFAKWSKIVLLYCPSEFTDLIKGFNWVALELNKAWEEVEGYATSEPTKEQIERHSDAAKEYREWRDTVIMAMRKDIQDCANLKFRDNLFARMRKLLKRKSKERE